MGTPSDLDDLGLFSGYGSLVFTGRKIRSKGTDIPFTATSPQGRSDSLLLNSSTGRCSIWCIAPLASWLVFFGVCEG